MERDDLERCKKKMRNLKIELQQLRSGQGLAEKRLLMLQMRHSFKELIGHMKLQQGEIRRKQSGATHANRVANAYRSVALVGDKKR